MTDQLGGTGVGVLDNYGRAVCCKLSDDRSNSGRVGFAFGEYDLAQGCPLRNGIDHEAARSRTRIDADEERRHQTRPTRERGIAQEESKTRMSSEATFNRPTFSATRRAASSRAFMSSSSISKIAATSRFRSSTCKAQAVTTLPEAGAGLSTNE